MSLNSLEEIAKEVHDCTKCPLAAGRLNAVPGSGNPKADILFIGEGPGAKEDATGLPFVGAAGKFLDEMLADSGMKREDVFITNIVKCRPPENRDPLPEEKDICTTLYLDTQIDLINPLLIVMLGRHSMEYFLPGFSISAVHGKPMRRKGRVYMPLFHPAAALYNGSLRETLKADFRKVPKLLDKIRKERADSEAIIESMKKDSE
jgi:DNA polymerase